MSIEGADRAAMRPGQTARVAILFGGRSAEHDVSLRSAASVLSALDRARFSARLVPVDREGRFCTVRGEANDPTTAMAQAEPGLDLRELAADCDVALPLIHGPGGEDGSLQGLLEQLGVPYVGSGVFASSLCMDKGLFKVWLGAHGLPQGPFVCLTDVTPQDAGAKVDAHREALDALSLPLFVKPANLGSSVGVHRVQSRQALAEAVADAARYDRRIVVEAGLDGREIEVAVLDDGDAPPLVSDVGEIVLPAGQWYDYETKYERDVARLVLPAELDEATRQRARALALETFRACQCRGLARVDFFLERSSGQLYVNEVNTLPGFTSVSMYPKLIEHAGVPYPALLTRLLEQALAGR